MGTMRRNLLSTMLLFAGMSAMGNPITAGSEPRQSGGFFGNGEFTPSKHPKMKYSQHKRDKARRKNIQLHPNCN